MNPDSKPRPVFIAALPREIASLVAERGWRADQNLLRRNIHLFEHEQAIIACAGMGAQRAILAIEAALQLGPASELISIGWAGACIHRLRVGDVIRPDIVIDSRTGERFLPDKEYGKTDGLEVLVTVEIPADLAEKDRLARSYFASAVDMEAAAVGRIARARAIPFQAIKAISDDSKFELPDMAAFATPAGQFREAAFGIHVATRPKLWKPVMAMAKGSKLAAGHLQTEIKAHIAQQRNRTR
jgi:adenosylhomocysteine nucleosidase